jgi:alpha-glucosidase
LLSIGRNRLEIKDRKASREATRHCSRTRDDTVFGTPGRTITAVAADSRHSLGSIVAAVAFVAAGCVTSAEADERSPELVPLASPETVATATSPSTTTSTLPPTTTTTLPANDCAVAPIAAPFYEKRCSVLGIEIVGSGAVSDEAIEAAAEHVHGMLLHRLDLAEALAEGGISVAVIGADERITDLPDFADLYRLYPGTEWRRTGRSFPGTAEIPMAAGAEENLLCLEGDRFAGQDLFARDFARTILRFGLAEVDTPGQREIERAFNRAVGEGLWKDTVAEVNADQYWAEITQSHFDVNGYPDEEDDVESVRTRNDLRRYDPYGYGVALAVYTDTAWRPPCH